MKNPLESLLVVLPFLMAACVSSPDERVETPLDSDPRIGEEVNQICFSQTVHSWNSVDNDRNAVILTMSNRNAYKLKITPGCDPDWAMSQIAIIRRHGSSCYARGDRIRTDANEYGTSCSILAIHKWYPDALKK